MLPPRNLAVYNQDRLDDHISKTVYKGRAPQFLNRHFTDLELTDRAADSYRTGIDWSLDVQESDK
jgi:hypothetical protein